MNKKAVWETGAVAAALLISLFATLGTALPNELSTRATLPIEQQTLQLTAPENTTNETLTFDQVLRPEKTTLPSMDELIEQHEEKLTEQTKDLLRDNPQRTERFLIKHSRNFDNEQLDRFNDKTALNSSVVRFSAKGEDLAAILADADIEAIEIDQPLALSLWNVERVGAPSVWNVTEGEGVRVAVLDTGSIVAEQGWNVLENNDDFTDTDGHGTAVSGVVASVSPDSQILAVKIMESNTGYLSDALLGLAWAVENDADIITMSFGFSSYSQLFRDAADDAYDDGVLLVAASGNDGDDTVLYPAAYSSVIVVGATNEDDERASFSNYGLELELVAPGENVPTIGLDGPITASGTSIAAPHAAGVAALLLSYNKSLTNDKVRGILQNTAFDLGAVGWDTEYGYGVVQATLTGDTAVENISYHYGIYNVTSYGTENETLTFWLGGFGTIDDVDFAEGHYLVNKSLGSVSQPMYIFVDENGTIFSLTVSTEIDWDSYSFYSNNQDGVVWESGLVDITAGFTANKVHCYDYDYTGSFTYDECWGNGAANFAACEALDASLAALCSASPSKCHDDTASFNSEHSFPSSALASNKKITYRLRDYITCSGFAGTGDDNNNIYVIDKLNTSCISSNTKWRVSGYHGTGSDKWVKAEDFTCPGGYTCDSNVAGYVTTNKFYNYETADSGVNYPCVPIPTNGTVDLAIVNVTPIQVIPNVDMVKGKSGYVLVEITNYGNSSAEGLVRSWFNGTELQIATSPSERPFAFVNDNPRTINPSATEYFAFNFTPLTSGTNIAINASVEISS